MTDEQRFEVVAAGPEGIARPANRQGSEFGVLWILKPVNMCSDFGRVAPTIYSSQLRESNRYRIDTKEILMAHDIVIRGG